MTVLIGKSVLALIWLYIYVRAYLFAGQALVVEGRRLGLFSHYLKSYDFLAIYLDEAFYQSDKRIVTSSYFRHLSIIHGSRDGERRYREEIQRMLRDAYLLAGLLLITMLWLDSLFVIVLAATWARIFLPRMKAKQRAQKLQSRLVDQLPIALMQLRLALESGMSLSQAWQEVAQSSQEEIYVVMSQVLKEEKAGLGTFKAFAKFGDQYRLTILRDVANLITHNLENGGKEIVVGLGLMQKDIYEKMKRAYRIASEEAKQKMVFPSLLLFLGILIIVLLPALGRSL